MMLYVNIQMFMAFFENQTKDTKLTLVSNV